MNADQTKRKNHRQGEHTKKKEKTGKENSGVELIDGWYQGHHQTVQHIIITTSDKEKSRCKKEKETLEKGERTVKATKNRAGVLKKIRIN